MAIEGDLGTFRLTDILQVIAQQHKTGILTLQGEREILAVSFLRGQIVAADALNQPFEESLGQLLASQGWIRPEVFSQLLPEHARVGGRLSDFLISKGVLDQSRLLEVMRLQIYRLVLEALRWNNGEFKFYSGEEVAHEAGMVPIPVEELLFRAMSDLIGEGTLSGVVPHGFVAYEPLPPSLPVRVGVRDLTEVRDDSAIWVAPDEERLYRLLDGTTTAAELARRTGLGEYKTLFALFRLLQLGLARPAAGAWEANSPGPQPVAEVLPAPISVPPASVRREEPVDQPVRVKEAREGYLADSISVLAAAVLALCGLILLYLTPFVLLTPPGMAGRAERLLERYREQLELATLDRSLRTYYLLEGRFPAELAELHRRGVLAPGLPSGAASGRLVFEAAADSYALRVTTGPGGPFREGILGDLFLDAELFQSLKDEGRVPLILLD